MVQQRHVFIAARLRQETRAELETLLASMNRLPGQADPANAVLPFGQLDRLHVALFVILDDPSLPDRAALGTRLPASEPVYLAFIADFDGEETAFLAALVTLADAGLRRIFAHCSDFAPGGDLLAWLRDHCVPTAANYVNWIGRTTRQIAEEQALHDALRAARIAQPDASPEALLPVLREAARAVPLTPIPGPGPGERFRDAFDLLLLPLIALIVSPLLLVGLIPFILWLRWSETHAAVLAPVPDRARNNMLSGIEDHDITNQYSASGSLKPGLPRRWLTIVILWIINWGARHLYPRARLARVNTIHFASWTFLDDKRRVYFASNYDGSREAYNDDFINKVAFGLNASFSNGLGYPRTDWLIVGGARHEQDFKRYLFHHQIPTQVWYKAFPGLSNYDMARNARIRSGFEKSLSGDALRRWIAEI